MVSFVAFHLCDTGSNPVGALWGLGFSDPDCKMVIALKFKKQFMFFYLLLFKYFCKNTFSLACGLRFMFVLNQISNIRVNDLFVD